MTTLTSCPTMPDAIIIKGMLEANGIPAVLSDQNNLYVPIFGGVDILVPDADYDRALTLLASHADQ